MTLPMDLTGQIFGRLTVLSRDTDPQSGTRTRRRWICQCVCGQTRSIMAQSLRNGASQSCGCLAAERLEEFRPVAHRTHGAKVGGRTDPVYEAWTGMKNRCQNRNDPAWKNYGGRGLTVASEWVTSFEAFRDHIGERPPGKHPSGRPLYTLDRIDNDRGYEPFNVRWATASEQAKNRRRRTHCEKGHEFTPENTYLPPGDPTHRMCRRCASDRYQARKEGTND